MRMIGPKPAVRTMMVHKERERSHAKDSLCVLDHSVPFSCPLGDMSGGGGGREERMTKQEMTSHW